MSGWFGWANAVAFTVGSQAVKWSDLLGNILALATVGFAVRRHIWTWPVQIASCVLLFGANVSVHLGGNAARQVALGVMAGYGGGGGGAGRRGGSTCRCASRPGGNGSCWSARSRLGTVAFASLLSATPASWAPWPDAYIFIGSLAATFAQARGWVEFWVVWVLVDVVGVPLAVSNGLVVSGAVYAVFLGMCLLGIRDWTIRSRRPAGVQGVMTDDVRTRVERSGRAEIAAGRAVVVVDDEDRENEGDLIFAAQQGHPGAGRLHDPLHPRRRSASRWTAPSSTGSTCRR